MHNRNFYIKDSELDDYRKQIINKRTDNSFIVSGRVGSGKLVLALWKAKQIQSEDRGTVQIIVFTKALKQYISEGARQIGINTDIVDYHWNWKNLRGSPAADYIIIYEAQYFSTEEIILMKEKANNAMFIFGESKPDSVMSKNFPYYTSMEEIALITGFPLETLVFTYSLPKKIARLAMHITSNESCLEDRCIYEGIQKPKILCFKNTNDQFEYMFKTIHRKMEQDVAVVFNTNREISSAYHYASSNGYTIETNAKVEPMPNPYLSWKSKEIKEFLKSMNITLNDIPIHDLYLKPENVYEEIKALRVDYDKKHKPPGTINFYSHNPKFLTYHSISGIVFDTVFLPNCNTQDVQCLYDAIIHTSNDLYIMYSGEMSPLLKNIPEDLFEKTETEYITPNNF